MIRYLFLGLNFLFFYFLELFWGSIIITTDVPKKADPGSDFIVKITIEKGDISGFAKLNQVLPEGFTASIVEANGASFTFNDQTIKLIWMSIPTSDSFTISYKVSVAADVKGTFGFGGKFSYLDGNQKRTVPIPDKQIQVGEGEATATTEPVKVPAEAVCSLSFTKLSDKEWKAEVSIVKKGIEGFAKIEEFIPDGISCNAAKSDDFVASFVDQKMKFVWMNLPQDEKIQVTYNLTLDDDVSPSLLNNIRGEFSFLENNETRKEIINITEPVPTEALATNETTITETQRQKQEDSLKADEEAKIKASEEEERLRMEEEQRLAAAAEEARRKKEEKMDRNKLKAEDSIATITNVTPPETGITYKVQICAGHKPVPGSHFANHYKYSESQVNIEHNEGWLKYTIDKYTIYKEAYDRRNQVTSAYNFPGPFVTAYNEGKRITVQEALMITKQQWYQ